MFEKRELPLYLKEAIIRLGPEQIREIRKRRASGVLVTGATGFLGSHLTVNLLRKGYRVYVLARPRKNVAARERIRRLLAWFGADGVNPENIRILEGSLDDTSLGLDPHTLHDLATHVDEIIHCASATSFSERRRTFVEKANVGNLKNLLAFAAGSRCSFFHHISTAYVAGKTKGSCREEVVENGEFTNVYEETKHLGERLVRKCCEEKGIRLNIYRPSIVYGDSQTGKTLRFDAVYYPMRTLSILKEVFERDIRENSGRRAAAMGISLTDQGEIHMPIRVEGLQAGGINLIPVDFFVEAFMAIMEDSIHGGIFHIVNPRPKLLQELTAYGERFLRVSGIRPVPPGTFEHTPKNGLEILFGRYVEEYSPYMRDERVFESQQTDAILKRRGIECPDFNYPVFERCLQYAVETNWGRNLVPTTSWGSSCASGDKGGLR